MSTKQIKAQIAQLKGQLKAQKKTSDRRLVKLTLIMVILLVFAALLYGRIQL